MSQPAIKFEDARDKIGILPSLGPHPNATNIQALCVNLVNKLTTIPSQQSAEFGYAGMVEQEEIYALNATDPWVNFPDPGVHRIADGTLDGDEQRDAEVIFNANKKVYDSESNVRRAIIDEINAVVPRQYKCSGGTPIGSKMYKANDCPRTILNNLRSCYGRLAPIEKTQNEAQWSAPWNPSDPVEDLFDRLEECYIIPLTAKPAYTQDHMIGGNPSHWIVLHRSP